MIDRLLSLLAPHICSGCAEIGAVICESCTYDISSEEYGRCIWCLKPTAGDHQCAACRRHSGVSAAWAVGEREGVLKHALNDYKFESRRQAVDSLVALLDQRVPVLPSDVLVAWVPTAPAHIRQRGFDHGALLARTFARRRGLDVRQILGRRHQARSQHELSRADRLKAAERSFRVMQLAPDRPVLIIDDILTTGATLRACVSLLRAAGVETIYVAILARQPKR